MGPLHPSSVSVRTGIEPGARPWSARSVRIPLTHLSQSMRSMHQRGLIIESVRFEYSSDSAVVREGTAAPSKPKAAVIENAKTAEKTAKKPARRRRR